MRRLDGKTPLSPVSRFLLGAGIGVAISVPLFNGIDDVWVRILFMMAFAGVMGAGQVVAGGTSARSRKTRLWLLAAGAVSFAAGVAVYLAVS